MRSQVQAALKAAEPEVHAYVKNLEAENARLQRKIAKLECDNMSYKHRVASLQKELKKYLKKGHLTVLVNRNVGVKT